MYTCEIALFSHSVFPLYLYVDMDVDVDAPFPGKRSCAGGIRRPFCIAINHQSIFSADVRFPAAAHSILIDPSQSSQKYWRARAHLGVPFAFSLAMPI